jgi:hypothetical protein
MLSIPGAFCLMQTLNLFDYENTKSWIIESFIFKEPSIGPI